MKDKGTKFELPKNIDRYLAALSKLYGQEGNRQLQEIIVNAQVRLHEEWSVDNLDGGTFGHALYLSLPEPIYLRVAKQKHAIQKEINADINKIHNVRNEFIEEVFLEMEIGPDQEWRKESGLLVTGKRTVTAAATKRVWGSAGFRIFLSHKTSVKKETSSLKTRLELFGVSGFVAHQDIHPTREWQDEIENALETMDGFVALMTEDFHESDWTDHEVGFAFARGVPLIAVQLGKTPYGFLGKFQGLASKWEDAAADIVRVLIKNDRMFSAYVQALRKCPSWSDGNILAAPLASIEELTEAQVDELVSAYNDTSELRGSFGFGGSKPRHYGPGLVFYLNKHSARKFRFTDSGMIKAESSK